MQKKRKLDFEAKNGIKINGMVRNHENGFIYARQEIAPPKKVIDEAVKAVSALGLNFGGVDVIYNEKKDAAYVLESNSSIGLEPEGTTLKRLAAAFRAICDGKPPVSII
jgi:D-alanine-D-alanine ligase-like ATP-grasp enzyme